MKLPIAHTYKHRILFVVSLMTDHDGSLTSSSFQDDSSYNHSFNV